MMSAKNPEPQERDAQAITVAPVAPAKHVFPFLKSEPRRSRILTKIINIAFIFGIL
jgi:hypothetical protein